MTVAFLFPGQGVAIERGVVNVLAQSPAARDLVDRASRAAGSDLWPVLVRDGAAGASTRIVQPLLTAICLGIYQRFVDAGIRPAWVAGHSLGEMAAWSAAGCIDAETAVDLCGLRGHLMEQCATKWRNGRSGAMAAVTIPNDTTGLESLLALGTRYGEVEVAAENAPGEWVLTGDVRALDAIAGQYHATRLPVSGAWHSRAMAGALIPFRQALDAARTRPVRVRLVSNQTGCEVRDSANMPRLLAEQLVRPIRWVQVVNTLARAGVDTYVTVGPGKVLRSFIRKNLAVDRSGAARLSERILATETPFSLARTIEVLAHEPPTLSARSRT